MTTLQSHRPDDPDIITVVVECGAHSVWEARPSKLLTAFVFLLLLSHLAGRIAFLILMNRKTPTSDYRTNWQGYNSDCLGVLVAALFILWLPGSYNLGPPRTP